MSGVDEIINFKAMENSSEVGPEVLDQKMAEPTNGTSNGSKVCQ